MPALSQERKAYSISELTRVIRTTLEGRLGTVWVEGEISNLRKQSSGHQYFSLKDKGAQLRSVLFRGNDSGEFELRDGMKILAYGDVTVYEAQGQYQLIVRAVQPLGLGELQARFEALKRKLNAEGLFAPERKRPIPKYPKVVGLITSPTGAAIQDMLNVFSRRAPWVRLLIVPVRVQGDGAAEEISQAIRWISQSKNPEIPRPDTLVVARGGGSIEDLWNFNEEVVARALAESPIPTVSGVGHEIDFTIADFVADLRAPTPSAAAELVVPDGAELRQAFQRAEARILHSLQNRLDHGKKVLQLLERSGAFQEPKRVLLDRSQRVDDWEARLTDAAQDRLRRNRERLSQAKKLLELSRPERVLAQRRETLEQLSSRLHRFPALVLEQYRQRLENLSNLARTLGPEAVLSRGYTLTADEEGQVITDPSALRAGQTITTRFAGDAEVSSRVESPPSLPKRSKEKNS
ncbi:MAG: exodeoxyribonuclease VII large subunit [Verrucomicrobiota bacterium]